MASHDPDVRHFAAVKAGVTSAAKKSPEEHAAAMARAREAQRQALIQEVDPTGHLAENDPEELDRQVDLLRRARFADMGLKSARARAERRRQEAEAQANAELDALAMAQPA